MVRYERWATNGLKVNEFESEFERAEFESEFEKAEFESEFE